MTVCPKDMVSARRRIRLDTPTPDAAGIIYFAAWSRVWGG
jgi:hypothetical protein